MPSQLSGICTVLGGYAYSSKDFTSVGVPVIKIADITSGGTIDYTAMQCVSKKVADQTIRFKPEPGDTLISMTGANVGKTSRVRLHDPDARINQRVGRFVPIAECGYSKDYIHYVVASSFAYSYIANTAYGSAQPNISAVLIETLPIPNILAPEANRIGAVLACLDDKIDLNRRMNETLEAMARAIFKDWFVDFGPTCAKMEGRAPYLEPDVWRLFPDRLDAEGTPRGRGKKRLGELFDISIGRTPPRKETQHFVASGLGRPWLSIKTMGEVQSFAFASEEYLTPEAVAQFRVPLIPAGTVVVSFKLTVGRVAIAAQDMYSNEAIAHLVRTPSSPVASEYAYCFMKAFDYNSLGSTSSIATAVNSQSIKDIEMLVPDSASHQAFLHFAGPLFQRIKANGHESQILSQIRDLLLPKLMSGEIRVRDAEKIAEAAL
jgi:type I restriction enzyme, S subunit